MRQQIKSQETINKKKTCKSHQNNVFKRLELVLFIIDGSWKELDSPTIASLEDILKLVQTK